MPALALPIALVLLMIEGRRLLLPGCLVECRQRVEPVAGTGLYRHDDESILDAAPPGVIVHQAVALVHQLDAGTTVMTIPAACSNKPPRRVKIGE
jgi:hypothetical protein